MSIVIATYNRATTLLRCLAKLASLPQRHPIVVIDNGSRDQTLQAVRQAYPTIRTIRLARNIGAAARSVGVRAVHTPYIAFCDDDCWWAPGSLRRAAALLDAHGDVAVLNARVLVGDEERLDDACRAMAAGDLPKTSACPGQTIGAFMAGAAVVRRSAFLAAGGYHRRYHIGAEESLLALDLLAAGWQLIYDPELVLYHHPSDTARDPLERRRLVLRNRLWTKWLRHSAGCALASTGALLRAAGRDPAARAALFAAVRGAPWIVRERRPVPRSVERLVDRLAQLPA